MARARPRKAASAVAPRRAILFGPRLSARGANEYLKQLKFQPSDFKVGVDAGTAIWRELDLMPDLAVGDWDGLTDARALEGIDSVVHLPRDKDASDFQHALDIAIGAGARRLVGVGFTGGALDQQLGVYYDLATAASGRFGPVREVSLWDADFEVRILSAKIPRWRAALPSGTRVSVFSLGGPATGVTLTGFKFPLNLARLEGSTRGLGNETLGREVEVRVGRGTLMIFVRRQAGKSS